MKKDTILVILFILILILNGTLFIVSDVIVGNTQTLQIIVATLFLITGIGTYIYLKK